MNRFVKIIRKGHGQVFVSIDGEVVEIRAEGNPHGVIDFVLKRLLGEK